MLFLYSLWFCLPVLCGFSSDAGVLIQYLGDHYLASGSLRRGIGRCSNRNVRELGGGCGWNWFSRQQSLRGGADRRRRVREWKARYEMERDGGARERARYEVILQQLVEEARGGDGQKGEERKKDRELTEPEECDIEHRELCLDGMVEETGWRRCRRESVISGVLERRSVVRDWRKKYKGKQRMNSEGVGVAVSKECRIGEGGDGTMLVWTKEIKNVEVLKTQVLQVPQHIIKTGCLRGKTCIQLYDSDIDVNHMCELHTSKRKYTVEQYLGKGWYAYVRQKEVTKGDMIEFRIDNAGVARIAVRLVKSGKNVRGS